MKNLKQALSGEFHCIICDTLLQIHIPAISDDRYGCPGVYSIARCPNCGHMATLPRLKESDLPALYSRFYPRREVNYAELAKEAKKVTALGASLRRWLAGTNNQGHYLARPGQRVLDIGSGSCLALLELRAMGVEAFGVEADPNVRPIAEHFDLNVHIGSIHDEPFVGELFDIIVLNQVIEHVPDPLALLRAVRVRLKPNGRVVLAFPNTESIQAERSGVRWINWHVPYHQHHFNCVSFAKLAEKTDYEVTRMHSITPNLWTLLQLRVNREKPIEGKVSATWGSSAQLAKEQTSLMSGLKRGLRAYARYVLTTLFGVINRVRDARGRGDSLLVELRITEKSELINQAHL